ncbi:hypothetical protein GCM10010377_52670 [Streptomyces viridiviolaceus]|nr:hypothetical protein GCM10010377_52670 [Streptomyces viridiviolaceus]
MHLHGRTVSIQPLLQQPVGRRRPVMNAALPLAFSLLGYGDGLPYLVEGEGEPGLQGAETGQLEISSATGVASVGDSAIVGHRAAAR